MERRFMLASTIHPYLNSKFAFIESPEPRPGQEPIVLHNGLNGMIFV
jgi:hypothetical protein